MYKNQRTKKLEKSHESNNNIDNNNIDNNIDSNNIGNLDDYSMCIGCKETKFIGYCFEISEDCVFVCCWNLEQVC